MPALDGQVRHGGSLDELTDGGGLGLQEGRFSFRRYGLGNDAELESGVGGRDHAGFYDDASPGDGLESSAEAAQRATARLRQREGVPASLVGRRVGSDVIKRELGSGATAPVPSASVPLSCPDCEKAVT